jgi:DNA-directed RNA polymerase specialized sigma subunit
MAEDFVSRVPWSAEPSLKEKTEEVGIDFDSFIAGLEANKTDTEMAEEFNVSTKTITHLREHFEHLGIHSIMGQD